MKLRVENGLAIVAGFASKSTYGGALPIRAAAPVPCPNVDVVIAARSNGIVRLSGASRR
jgi:hypothetical protein